MKKLVALLLSVLMVCSLFTGCASKDESKAEEPAAPAQTEAPSDEKTEGRDLADLKSNLHKVQLALEGEDISDYLRQRLEIMNIEKRGSLYTVTATGDLDIIMTVIRAKEPVFCESLPLSLEEIFISETEVIGYDIKKLIF